MIMIDFVVVTTGSWSPVDSVQCVLLCVDTTQCTLYTVDLE